MVGQDERNRLLTVDFNFDEAENGGDAKLDVLTRTEILDLLNQSEYRDYMSHLKMALKLLLRAVIREAHGHDLGLRLEEN